MQLSSYRLADYRLAAYVVAAAVMAGGVTFAFDRLTAPASKVQANGAPPSSGAVRQIPIARTSAPDRGDPDNKLSPVYPASPGKDLPVKDTPVVQAAKPVETNGSATPNVSPATVAAQPVLSATTQPAASTTTTPASACNVAACASAYRSFRESDCSYQPLSGPRRLCEGAPGAGQIASQPAQSQNDPAAHRSSAAVTTMRCAMPSAPCGVCRGPATMPIATTTAASPLSKRRNGATTFAATGSASRGIEFIPPLKGEG